jgi:hypothetical protein
VALSVTALVGKTPHAGHELGKKIHQNGSHELHKVGKRTGLSSVAGLFGVRQQVYDHSLRADAYGNFAFTFRPQIAIPGTRYEITMNATKADLRTETQLVLFQQQ